MICTVCDAVTSQGARFCSMCGAALVAPSVGRERRYVSVVFVDLADFSHLTSGFDPEELRDLADEVLTVIAGVIEDYDGYVDAFRGDGLIALFGAPHSHPDDPKRAVLAAAAALRAIKTVGGSKGLSLMGRAGVNTGVVIAGSVGLGRIRDYTVMGTAVNLAARLEAAAAPGEVWVGRETFEATRHTLPYQPTPPVTLRGFPDLRHVYRLVLEERQPDPYGDLTFVGRKRELAALHHALEGVTSTGAVELWLTGEAGSGKTRLLEEFSRTLEGGKVVWVREGADPERVEGRWLGLASELLDLSPHEDAALLRQQVLAKVASFDPHDTMWHGAILRSLGLFERRTKERRTTEAARRRAHANIAEAWYRLLVALTRTGPDALPTPLLLMVDTGKTNTTFEPLLDLLRESRSPMLILRTSRGRNLPAGAQTLPLTPLSFEESMALLGQLVSPVLEVATRSLVAQVGGIPSYVLELGSALSSTPSTSFSGSLTSLLQARLDMLSPPARTLLAQAALTGERCWEGLLRAGGRVEDELQELTEEMLLIEEAASTIPGEREYRFQSELLRNAVLRMVPFRDRPAVHLRIATWLEQHAPLELSPLTAHHFEEAGSPEGAYPHYLAAADAAVDAAIDAAVDAGSFEEAFGLFERLLSLRLGPELMAQAALAYAQAALRHGDRTRTLAKLDTAQDYLCHCHSERGAELRGVYEGLHRETATLSESF